MVLDKNTALLLIDIQDGLDEPNYYGTERNNLNAEEKASQILNFWRKKAMPIYHIQHSSQNQLSPLHHSKQGFKIKKIVQPAEHESIIVKNVNSAFIGTNLHEILTKKETTTIVMVGLTTNHCVSTTARMAGNLGYEVFVISDATAAFDRIGVDGKAYGAELIHNISLSNLQEEFAEVITTAELLSYHY